MNLYLSKISKIYCD